MTAVRRYAWLPLCLAAALLTTLCAAAPRTGEMVVTLVGTGGPELTPKRSGEATVVQAVGQTLLFDAGRNTLDNLYRSRIPPQSVTRIFLTHLHSDHIAGLPDLWITPWFLLGRTVPLEIWGPPGTQAMVDGMRAMYGHDLQHRPNAALPRAALDIVVHEIQPGEVYHRDGITVTATAVEHADGDPAYAYRVEAAGRVVLLTGDCTWTPDLAAAARGADVVVANVAAATPELQAEPRMRPILAKLLSPEQAARLFTAAKPRLAVYSHIVKKGLPGEAGDRVLLARTRAAGYRGPLRMGHDHSRIVIGQSVRVEAIGGRLPDFDGPGAHF